MCYPGEMLKRFEQLGRETDFVVEEAFNDTAPKFTEQQREQLERGLTADGETIRPRYQNAGYARMKQAMNSKPGLGNPDLKLTGSFHRQIFIDPRVDSGVIVVGSTDEKAEDLEEKYGGIIFGLGGEYKAVYVGQALRPSLLQAVSQIVKINPTK
jgi:hypothetical protein